ncbi:hypothetical protein JCM10212_006717 [Sporobolomyces blumeae]
MDRAEPWSPPSPFYTSLFPPGSPGSPPPLPSLSANLDLDSPGWESLQALRPRLKRSHSVSEDCPSAPPNSPQSPVQAHLAAFPTSGSPTSPWTTAAANDLPIHHRARTGSNASGLDPIDEVPVAEVDPSTAIRNRAISGSRGARPPPDHHHEPVADDRDGDDDEYRPRKAKKRKTQPDHEAFGRLTLSNSRISTAPRSSTGVDPAAATSPPRPTSLALPPGSFVPLSGPSTPTNPTSSPVTASFPRVPPTSPVFHPSSSPPNHSVPPIFSPLYVTPPPLASTPLHDPNKVSPTSVSHAAATGAFERSRSAEPHEVEMGNGPSSWEIDPHRIYVNSLSDDDDDDDDDGEEDRLAREKAEEAFRLNALATRSNDNPLLPSSILHSINPSTPSPPLGPKHAQLILYQPPPALPGSVPPNSPTSTTSRLAPSSTSSFAMRSNELFPPPTTTNMARQNDVVTDPTRLSQRIEKARDELDEEYREFRRESERVESMHERRSSDEEDGRGVMEVDMEY